MTNSKLIYGVGINDRSRPSGVGNGLSIATKESNLWIAMLKRCYNKKYHEKYQTYIGCSVSDNFKHYSYFYDWCHKQIGFNDDSPNQRKWHLDKDILIPDNKIYSEYVCVFVPPEINTFFTNRGLSRGRWPIGVYFHEQRSKFMAYCSVNGKDKYLGYFATPEEAHAVYKQFKENLCKETAAKWRGQVDNRVYDAMMVWGVE